VGKILCLPEIIRNFVDMNVDINTEEKNILRNIQRKFGIEKNRNVCFVIKTIFQLKEINFIVV